MLKTAALTIAGVLLLANITLYAAKGGSKEKKGYVLKFNGFDIRSSFQNNLQNTPGLMYKGSFNDVNRTQQPTTINSIIKFQKGNTIFIYPYHQQVKVPRFKTPQKQDY